MKSFKNKVVVITGAGSGIGRALALVLSKRGAKLALNDFDRESLDETKSMLQGNVLTEAFDVSDKEKMYAFATRIKTELGSAHAIINNAGIEGSTKPAFLTEPKEYERTMQVNFNGVLYGTLAFLPQLVENNEGAVINISSIFGLIGVPNNADYCASKFAVRGFTETLMAEFEESPINIHCVHPGGIATSITKKKNSQAFAQKYLKTKPIDIANYIIEKVESGKPKIVYGKDSFKVWLASNLIPQGLLKKIIWRESKPLVLKEEYSAFLK